jgi:hypothetical protein
LNEFTCNVILCKFGQRLGAADEACAVLHAAACGSQRAPAPAD